MNGVEAFQGVLLLAEQQAMQMYDAKYQPDQYQVPFLATCKCCSSIAKHNHTDSCGLATLPGAESHPHNMQPYTVSGEHSNMMFSCTACESLEVMLP